MYQDNQEPVINWLIYFRAANCQYSSVTEFSTASFAAYTKAQAITLFKQSYKNVTTVVLAVIKDFNGDVRKKSNKVALSHTGYQEMNSYN